MGRRIIQKSKSDPWPYVYVADFSWTVCHSNAQKVPPLSAACRRIPIAGAPPAVGTWIWEDNLDVFDSSLVLFTWLHVIFHNGNISRLSHLYTSFEPKRRMILHLCPEYEKITYFPKHVTGTYLEPQGNSK